MITFYAEVVCSMCGCTDRINLFEFKDEINSSYENIVRSCCIELQSMQSKRWGYVGSSDEFICHDCDTSSIMIRISDEELRNVSQYSSQEKKRLEYFERLAQEKIKLVTGLNSDKVVLSDIDVRALVDPATMATEFYVTPTNITWSELKNAASLTGDYIKKELSDEGGVNV